MGLSLVVKLVISLLPIMSCHIQATLVYSLPRRNETEREFKTDSFPQKIKATKTTFFNRSLINEDRDLLLLRLLVDIHRVCTRSRGSRTRRSESGELEWHIRRVRGRDVMRR